jgi:hypothetical protein
MTAMKYDVRIDLGALLDGVGSAIDAAVLPTVHQAIKAVAAETAYRWKDSVAKASLWAGEKQPYMDSIRWLMVGDFSAVVSTDYDLASDIETGRPPRDMKRMLDTSMKVRTVEHGKNAGKRYLIIPFRHNTPGHVAMAQAMPSEVYKKARMLDASTVTGMGSRLSGTGAMSMKTKAPITVPQRSYKWGDRLPPGAGAKLKDYHSHDRYAGMVRFNTSAGKGKSSSYLTFRVMMEGSPGWIIPAKSGLYLAKAVRDQMELEAPNVFAEAIRHLK